MDVNKRITSFPKTLAKKKKRHNETTHKCTVFVLFPIVSTEAGRDYSLYLYTVFL